MAGSVNKVMLVGNLGRDPEVRRTSDNRAIANLAVATSDKWTDRESGEKKQRTEWHSVTVYNSGIVSVVEKYLKKGARVLVEGSLRYTEATDENKVARRYADVVLGARSLLTMLDRAVETVEATPEPAAAPKQPASADDEIPF